MNSIKKSIIESSLGDRCKLSGVYPTQVIFRNLIRGKKFLFVLDDYWSEEYMNWDMLCSPFKVGARGSMIILTTRNTIVSQILGNAPAYCLESLNDENCWELMKQRAYRTLDNDLERIGRMLATKCRGLPLTAKTLESMLHFKDDPVGWRSILGSEIWDLPNMHLKRKSWSCYGFILLIGKLLPEDLSNDYFEGLWCRTLFQYSHHQKVYYRVFIGGRCKLSGLYPIQVSFRNLIRGKKFLLVLDDYWSEKYKDYDMLYSQVGARGSMIILTTRHTIVSRILGNAPAYCLESLNDENCWELMKQRAYRTLDNDLERIERMIATRCRGLPLAAKTLGSVLHFKDDLVGWRSILESEIWDLRQDKMTFSQL
ncbi:putative disease resistance protein RGA3 [Sesamum indicum]|uniref:Disease resistance protein RGA3 n=1 Tax=Sesamum indicum TaxID=4182 RepID=A0A6I9SJW0_SESIN|nr:putative disease resistance protein RGA3 [Sesamum indicum]